MPLYHTSTWIHLLCQLSHQIQIWTQVGGCNVVGEPLQGLGCEQMTSWQELVNLQTLFYKFL